MNQPLPMYIASQDPGLQNNRSNSIPGGQSGYNPPSRYARSHNIPNWNTTANTDIRRRSPADFPHDHSQSQVDSRAAILDDPNMAPNLAPPESQFHVKINPNSHLFQPTTSHMSNFLSLDATIEVITDNIGIVSPSGVKYDSRWMEQLTQLPLTLKSGYIGAVPTDTVVPEDEFGPIYKSDADGPPRGNRWLPWWNSGPENDDRQRISAGELKRLTERHNDSHQKLAEGKRASFVLPLVDRRKLYKKLFCKILITRGDDSDNRRSDYIDDIIYSKIFTIFSIENFLLETLNMFQEIGVDQFPSLSELVRDFYHILDILTKGDKIKLVNIQEKLRLDQVVLWSEDDCEFRKRWESRWKDVRGFDIINSTRVRRDYICGVFDAMFGLWPAPGHCFLHDSGRKIEGMESDSDMIARFNVHGLRRKHESNQWVSAQEIVPRCINSGLYFWEELPPEPEVGDLNVTTEDIEKAASISLVDLDAFLIERRMPFKFKRTNHLNMHLNLTLEHEILIFPHWRQFLMLRHHRMLVDDSRTDYPHDEISLFHLLSRSTRTPINRTRGIGGDVRYIAYELLQTYALLFCREISSEKYRGHYYREAMVFGKRMFLNNPGSSEKIAKRVGLDFTDSLGFETLMRDMWEGDYLPQSGDFKIFGRRLEVLNKELNVWKPSTFWEMLSYRGWVEEELNYWALFFTATSVFVFALITLILTCVQVYFAVHPKNPSS